MCVRGPSKFDKFVKNGPILVQNLSNFDKRSLTHLSTNCLAPSFAPKDDGSSDDHFEKKLTLLQACGLNTMNMFGTGPFITIPFVVASTDPAGPQALIGYHRYIINKAPL